MASLLTVAALAGCTVGPDFQRPAAPTGNHYDTHPLASSTASTPVTGGAAQRIEPGRDIPADWWTLFQSPALDTLVRQALAHNPDLAAAREALTAAHEGTLAGRGGNWPSVTAELAASREKDPAGALAPVPSNNAYLYNLFTPQVSVGYTLDVFGANRRANESLAAQEQATAYQLDAARITLSSNVVLAAVQAASLRTQLQATDELLAINRHMLDILQRQYRVGYAGKLDLSAQTAQLAQVQAGRPDLVKQLRQQEHLLAVLAGQTPAEGVDTDFRLDALHLPTALPLSLPAQLVEQRPDVLQAEAALHAASADIGVATAARLPNLSLSATVGRTALTAGGLNQAGTGFWNIGADLAAPILQGGALRHQQRAAEATYRQAAAQYRSTVLTAFQDVADTLTAIEQDAQALHSAATAAAAARTALDLSRRQWKDGYANMLTLLNAEQTYQQARIALVQAQAARYADTAALFQALGGGWWHDSASTSGKEH